MKGKKIISAALAGVMALSLTACGGGSAQETTAAPAAGSKAEETTAAAEGSEAATGEGVTKEDLKVGFIFIGDENEGYTAAHYKGAKEMQEALGLNDDQLIVKWNIRKMRQQRTQQWTWRIRDARSYLQTALAMNHM